MPDHDSHHKFQLILLFHGTNEQSDSYLNQKKKKKLKCLTHGPWITGHLTNPTHFSTPNSIFISPFSLWKNPAKP